VDDEEEDDIDDSYNHQSPSIRDSCEFGTEVSSPQKEESDSMDAVRDSFSDSANDSGVDYGGYENDVVGEYMERSRNLRKGNTNVEAKYEKYDNEPEQLVLTEDEDDGEALLHHLGDLFFDVAVAINTVEADEQDVLIIGHPNQPYLDIRDKDFFNVASGDDAGNMHLARTMLSQLEDSIHHPLSETVEEFYSGGIGIDAEYF